MSGKCSASPSKFVGCGSNVSSNASSNAGDNNNDNEVPKKSVRFADIDVSSNILSDAQSNNDNNSKKIVTMTTKDAINGYANAINDAKKKMIKVMSKEDMADIIFKQNSVLTQQASQMSDVIDIANVIEKDTRRNEATRCNIIVRRQNQICDNVNSSLTNHVALYKNTTMTQIFLFILFVLLLFWLAYQCMFEGSQSSKTFTSVDRTDRTITSGLLSNTIVPDTMTSDS